MGVVIPPPPPPNVRSSLYGLLKQILPGVGSWPVAIGKETEFPAVMYTLENVRDVHIAGDPPAGRVRVKSTGYFHVHSFNYDKSAATANAEAVHAALIGLRGAVGTIFVVDDFGLVNMTDMENYAPDGSGRVLYDTWGVYSFGWK